MAASIRRRRVSDDEEKESDVFVCIEKTCVCRRRFLVIKVVLRSQYLSTTQHPTSQVIHCNAGRISTFFFIRRSI